MSEQTTPVQEESKLKIVTLQDIKDNARIEGDEENKAIERMGAAAERAVLNILECTLDELKAENDGEVPPDVYQAILMVATNFYEHRSQTNPTELYNVPYTVDMILRPYIHYKYVQRRS